MNNHTNTTDHTALFDTFGVPVEHRTDPQILAAADAIAVIADNIDPDDHQHAVATRNIIITDYVARIGDRLAELS